MAPTGKQIAFTAMAFWRLADGAIVEHWANLDAMGDMQQLGAIPAPVTA